MNLPNSALNPFAIHRVLTIKSKLILLLVLTTISVIAAITYISSKTQRDALTQAAFDQLQNRLNTDASEVTFLMEFLRSQMAILADNRTVVAAAVELENAYNRLHTPANDPAGEAALTNYYTERYLPALSAELGAKVTLATLLPTAAKTQFLQLQYIVKEAGANGVDNASAAGKGPDSIEAIPPAESLYSQVHAQYDALLQALAAQLGFSDLLLIGYETEEVIYTTAKHPELGTSLIDGPYRTTHLADLVYQMKRGGTTDVAIVDFQAYPPALGKPVAFLGAIVANPAGTPIAFLVAQLTPALIDNIVTDGQAWQSNGRGATGETYIVGSDLLMRTTARFLVEARDDYIAELRANGQPEENISKIERTHSSILAQHIETDAVREALAGRSDIRIMPDYRGRSTLTAYAPLAIEGLAWGMVAQMETAEAYASLTTLQQQIFVAGAVLIFGVILIALAATTLLTSPLRTLAAYAEQVQRGEFDERLNTAAKDEFGHLARALAAVMQTYQRQTLLLERRTTENRALLHSLLPPAVAARLQRGEERIVDTIHQTSLVCATLVGFTPLLRQQGEAATQVMDELMQAFDEAARRHELERQRTVGESYIAVCGLDAPHLDHSKRAVNFALELFQLLGRINEERELNLGLRVSVHSGAVVAGLLGGNKFMYNLWGAPLKAAMTLATLAERNTLLITDEVYKRLDQIQGFVRRGPLWVDEVGELLTWARLEQGRLTLRQIDLVQGSFAKCLPISEEVAEQFYYRLFELAPSARALFPTNMQEQQRKLMNTLNVAVGALNAPDKIIPILQNLGRKHVGYGASDDAYQVVGEALLWTLQVRLGGEFTSDTKEAWIAAYGWLSQVMISAAQEEAPSASATVGNGTATATDAPVAPPPTPRQQIAAARQAAKQKIVKPLDPSDE
ncbi:MAG: adenylate/guanylate cyclase domain-containing protein [Caldilineaceae bacterium]